MSGRPARARRTCSRRSPLDVLDDFASFYFDTALSSSPAALPTLLAFAKPGHVLFGSDWPFAPRPAAAYFAGCLDNYPLSAQQREGIDRVNVLALFPRLGDAPASVPAPLGRRVTAAARRRAVRAVAGLVAGC